MHRDRYRGKPISAQLINRTIFIDDLAKQGQIRLNYDIIIHLQSN